jgi:hypothetical protein
VPRFVRDNGLSLAFGAIFLASLVGQAISGADTFNHGQALHNSDPISFGHYVTSAVFWADVMENWHGAPDDPASVPLPSRCCDHRANPRNRWRDAVITSA